MASLTAEAKKKLAAIQKDTVAAAAVLGETEAKNTLLKSENERLANDNFAKVQEGLRLDKELEQKRTELTGLGVVREIQEGVVEDARRKTETHHTTLETEETRRDELISENAALEADAEIRRDEIFGLEGVRAKLNDEIKEKNGERVKIDQDLTMKRSEVAKLVEKEGMVKGSIDRALRAFALFQKRIARFTQETGFEITFEDPGALLEDTK